MDMPTQNRFVQALMRADGLPALARAMKEEGLSSQQVYDLYAAYLAILRAEGCNEEEEDAIVDCMDYITGWCSEHMKLFP